MFCIVHKPTKKEYLPHTRAWWELAVRLTREHNRKRHNPYIMEHDIDDFALFPTGDIILIDDCANYFYLNRKYYKAKILG